ncbi:MAG: hypothetical protein A2832_01280 [Candidatus Zambryskibacteria bacterium RIFCSPHIGHO2_01_FULL_44_22b]|uniref:Addiction module toxin, HicA family n=1 Tax=Candidatus Zambryskibacteria bacterium RIFCSPHIGHO2_01_FULL_44_22b TaxID=1802737 RepID=A0A1G2T313_9BACT|nr:MAG: hypothetical protein A2832_01280 [Candidatus Zambryskibacteria bacterium RIFCSPHIGHO2_01_FULL_44_22b]
MSNDIKHKDLYLKLGNIKRAEEWLKAAETLNLRICGGGKHPYTIRDPKKPDDNGKGSLIAVIQTTLHKTINQKIFKEILKFGIPEEDIWRALDLL